MTERAAPKTLMDFVKAAKAQIDEVQPEQAQQMLAEQAELVLLDVREPGEHQKGRIPNSLLVPRGLLEAAGDPSFPQHNADLVQARSKPLLIYCATGGRSALAAATLKQMGYERVYSLDGGYMRWEKEQRPVVRDAE